MNHRFEMTGDVCKWPYPKLRLQRELSPTAEMILLTTVVQQPGIKLRQVQTQLREYGIEVVNLPYAIFLHKNGFSYQRLTLITKKNGF